MRLHKILSLKKICIPFQLSISLDQFLSVCDGENTKMLVCKSSECIVLPGSLV